ncbi:MAG TPA: hypothetical protein PK020_06920 [Ilumatobacteraceae bacterium]|nr:hypothetical protein [Ilumatobacteraceae bacterium]
MTPTRVLDTRDPINLGLAGPFVSATSQKLKITGAIPTSGGTVVVVPAGATGVLLNVTAVAPGAAGYISIRPGNASGTPTTSSLNVEAGKNVPNSVQVALPTSGANAGQIDITYDAYGTAGPAADMLIDIVGYLTNTGLQELVNAQPIAKSASVNDIYPDPNGAPKVLVSQTIVAPVPGIIQMVGSSLIFNAMAGQYTCFISVGLNSVSEIGYTFRSFEIPTAQDGFCSTNGSLQVSAGTHIVNLVGIGPVGGDFDRTNLDVLFIAGGTLNATDVGAASDAPEKVEATP